MKYFEATQILEQANSHSVKEIREASKVINSMIRKVEAFDEIFEYEAQLMDADDAVEYGHLISKIVRNYESEVE